MMKSAATCDWAGSVLGTLSVSFAGNDRVAEKMTQPPQYPQYPQQFPPQQPQWPQQPYPPQYHPPQPPPQFGPSQPPRPRNSNTALLVFLLVLVVAGGGTGAFLLLKGGGKSGGGDAAPVSRYNASKAVYDPHARLGAKLQNAWNHKFGTDQDAMRWSSVIGDLIVVGQPSGITGVDLKTGKPRWTWKPQHQVCAFAAGATTLYLVQKSAEDDCDQTVALDLTGRQRWQNTLPDNVIGSTKLLTRDNTLLATGGGGIDWLDPASGKVLYKLGPGTAENGDFCTFTGAVLGDIGVALLNRCGWDIQNGGYLLHLYSTAIPPVRRFGAMSVPVNSSIVSADGKVVVSTPGKAGTDEPTVVRVFGPTGTVLATVNPAEVDPCLTYNDLHPEQRPACRVAVKDTMVVRNAKRGLSAYDAAGRLRWSTPTAVEYGSVGALAGDRLVAPVIPATRASGGTLAVLDPSTGRRVGGYRVTSTPKYQGVITTITGGWVVLTSIEEGVYVYAPA